MERKLTKAYRKAYQDNLIKRVKRQAVVESSNDTTTEEVELLRSEEDPRTSVKNHTAPDEFSANNSSEVNLPSSTSRNVSSSFDSDNRVDDEVESIFASLDQQNLFNGSVQSERLTSHEPKVLIHNIISGLPRPEIEMLYTVYQGKKSCIAKEI